MSADPTSRKEPDPRRFWRGAMWVIAALLIALVGAFFYDDPPPDDADFMPAFHPIDDEVNALAKLDDALKLNPPPNLNLSRNRQCREILEGREFWDEAVVFNFLTQGKPSLAALDDALAQPPEDWSWGDPKATGPHLDLSDGSRFGVSFRMIELLLLHAKQQVQSGQIDDCLQTVRKMFRMGSLLRNAQGATLRYQMSAAAFSFEACRIMREILPRLPPLAPPRYRELARDLAENELTVDSLELAVRNQYAFFKSMPESDQFEDLNAYGYRLSDPLGMPPIRHLLYRPHRPTGRFLDQTRMLSSATAQGFPQLEQAWAKLKASNSIEIFGLPGLIISNNAAGNFVATRRVGDVYYTTRWTFSMLADFRLLESALALRAFELDHGALPDTLDALVPEYFAAVPLDPYDGKPMRFNAATKVLYCVGEDLKEDGGDASAHPKIDDRSLLYPWAPAATKVPAK